MRWERSEHILESVLEFPMRSIVHAARTCQFHHAHGRKCETMGEGQRWHANQRNKMRKRQKERRATNEMKPGAGVTTLVSLFFFFFFLLLFLSRQTCFFFRFGRRIRYRRLSLPSQFVNMHAFEINSVPCALTLTSIRVRITFMQATKRSRKSKIMKERNENENQNGNEQKKIK